jgi:asparagine synthase (glutamine-hydrolysing)
MCGIVGMIDFKGRENLKHVVEKMLSVINYRGPDECGIYHSHVAAIGNVRLSIIDLAGGQQPMSDSSGRYWIVFNGEIFNYPELRKDLEKKGCLFRSQSDTEVLVQLYSMVGKQCLNMLNGQFAFAIWDKAKEELFIARDRVGIRPLFYNLSDEVFSFASEIKSLLQQSRITAEFNNQSLTQVYTFWAASSPETVFKNIYELQPGHYLVYNRNGLIKGKYWELSFNKEYCSISIDDAIERFHDLFTDAVRIRLRADVEVAAYLSGGIDSSATVAYIKTIEPGILNTFSIGFQERDYDETAFQNEAVKYFKTNHKSLVCTSAEIAESFPRVMWHAETPITRTAPTPMLLLSKLVRENNIKVVITGEGSDEILAGYNIFKENKIRRFWSTQPSSRIRPLLLKKLYPYLPQMKDASPNVLKMFFGYKLDDTENPFYSHLLRWNNANHIKKHFSDYLKKELIDYSPLSELYNKLPGDFYSWGDLEKSQWFETTIFMSGYLLSSQGDRMAMANSVEGRYPFLDYRIIEFCCSLPENFKLKVLNEKYLLKRLLHNKIPDSILRRSKQAYRAPIKSAFLSEKPPEYVKFMLSKEQTEKVGVFDYVSLSSVLSKIQKSGFASEVDNMLLTSALSTHLVHYQFIEKQNSEFKTGVLNSLRFIDDSLPITPEQSFNRVNDL